MKQVKRWKCDFCKKTYCNKGGCKRHEEICYYNPANRACITCGHNEAVWNTVYCPYYDGVPGSNDHEELIGQCCVKYDRWITKTDKSEQNLKMHCDGGWKARQ